MKLAQPGACYSITITFDSIFSYITRPSISYHTYRRQCFYLSGIILMSWLHVIASVYRKQAHLTATKSSKQSQDYMVVAIVISVSVETTDLMAKHLNFQRTMPSVVTTILCASRAASIRNSSLVKKHRRMSSIIVRKTITE